MFFFLYRAEREAFKTLNAKRMLVPLNMAEYKYIFATINNVSRL